MKKGNMILYEKETDYAIRFMEYINSKQGFPLEIQVFTDLEAIRNYIEEHEVDIFLVSIDILLAQIKIEQIKHIVYLTEDAEEECIEKLIIYKFQSIEKIKAYLLQILRRNGEKIGVRKSKKLELIGVCSSFGGSGKTLFSLAYGQAVSKNKKCLYIGLEVVKSFEGKEKGGTFSELLYYIKQNGELESVLIKLSSKVGELVCISSSDYFEDLHDMKKQDIEYLIDCLYEQGEYEVVIFDVGIWNEAIMYLLQKLDRIYMLQWWDNWTFPKESFLCDRIEKQKNSLLNDKIFKIKIPFDKDIQEGNFKLEKMLKTKLGQWVWDIRENELINVNKV